MTSVVAAACGVLREARIAEAVGGVVAVAGGGRADLLEARLEVLAMRGARGVASFGLCGALADGLAVGDWVIGAGLVGVAPARCDAGWRRSINHAFMPANAGTNGRAMDERAALDVASAATNSSVGPGVRRDEGVMVFADGQLAPTAAAKRALHAATGAVAIDMESHIAARVAARHNLPLLIARVVSDRADQSLPPAFAHAMRPDGGTDIAAMLASIARHPAQLPRVIGASADAVRALASLRQLGRLLGPGLGFPDFA